MHIVLFAMEMADQVFQKRSDLSSSLQHTDSKKKQKKQGRTLLEGTLQNQKRTLLERIIQLPLLEMHLVLFAMEIRDQV